MKYKLGLLGEQIGYSLSPQIFQWAFQQTGVAGVYALCDVPPEQLHQILHDQSARCQGLNVTTPYKSTVVSLCDQLSESAHIVGAVNTLHWEDRQLCGDNTDVEGFRFALRIAGTHNEHYNKVLLIGSGGAARAALYALSLDFEDLEATVVSRDPQLAQQKFYNLTKRIKHLRFLNPFEASNSLATFSLIIQATPVGSTKVPGCPLPKPLNFRPHALVMDLIYAPSETEFLAAAKSQETHTTNGLAMLIGQAAISFQLWTAVEFPLVHAFKELFPILSQQ